MKGLSMDKLKSIVEDMEENDITYVYDDEMKRIYEVYGDDAYYDRDKYGMDIVRKGKDYIKIKDR